jgi:signal transduction histidine kinase
LYIKDNGLGIDLEKHGNRLFGMYKTFHKNANARGLGLFITKNQIEAMNGMVEVESEVNVGTTFKITFHETI